MKIIEGKEQSVPGIRCTVSVPIVLSDGKTCRADIISFSGLYDDKEHLVLRIGIPDPYKPLVRVHSECLTGDVFGSQRCDCGPQLQEALNLLNANGGYLIYLRQEGRGIGLYRKLDAYRLQDQGFDTFAANRHLGHADDERKYDIAADMLKALDINRIALLTNNPEKARQLASCGIQVADRIPTGVFEVSTNREYLMAKKLQAQHTIQLNEGEQ